MKMAEVRARLVCHSGYLVHFERREGGLLCSDFFPARDEPSIADLADAWKLAEKWAEVDPDTFVNVYVIQAFDFMPVEGYASEKLNNYPTAPKDTDAETPVFPKEI